MAYTVARLHHVGVVVEDLTASIAWYTRHLGFQHQYDFELPGAQATMLVLGDARLELFQVDNPTPLADHRKDVATTLKSVGINHLALHVDDLDGAIEDLSAQGVDIAIPPTDVPNDSGDRFAFIRDNERTLVELFQPAA